MKRISAMLIVCLTAISLAGCGDFNATYDDNAAIARSGDSNSTVSVGVITLGNELSVTSATLTGSRTLWRYNASSDVDVTVSYSFQVTEGGKAKLVLITPDNEVIILAESTGATTSNETQTQTLSLKKGNNRIKIVGYDAAKFALRFSVSAGLVSW